LHDVIVLRCNYGSVLLFSSIFGTKIKNYIGTIQHPNAFWQLLIMYKWAIVYLQHNTTCFKYFE
jgi:hypothetical protein